MLKDKHQSDFERILYFDILFCRLYIKEVLSEKLRIRFLQQYPIFQSPTPPSIPNLTLLLPFPISYPSIALFTSFTMPFSLFLFFAALTTPALCLPANISSDSLASIDHIILFMQENRAFDHVSRCLSVHRNWKIEFLLFFSITE